MSTKNKQLPSSILKHGVPQHKNSTNYKIKLKNEYELIQAKQRFDLNREINKYQLSFIATPRQHLKQTIQMRNNLKARVQKANQNNISRLSDSFDNPNSPTYQNQTDRINKFIRSRKQCDLQIEDHLKLLTDYKFQMQDLKKNKSKEALKSFENHYDKYMNQILKDVKDILQNNKKRLMQQIIADKQRELGNQKEIKRRIEEQISQLREMKKGLGTENYKEYIARVVVYDFAYETKQIKESMNKLNYENVHLTVDQKKKECYRNDLQRIIFSKQHDLNRDEQTNSNLHQNRDMIKRGAWG